MTDEEHFDAALASVYDHHAATGHPLRFFTSMERLEHVCRGCGEVLYEGPVFTDPLPGVFEAFTASETRPRFKTEKQH